MRELPVALCVLLAFAMPAEAFSGCAVLRKERAVPSDVAPAIASRLTGEAVPFATPKGLTGTLHGVAALSTAEAAAPYPSSAPRHYRAVSSGALLGVLAVGEGWLDARGEPLPAGSYTLRYAVQPRMKDHFGTAERADFALLIPVDADDGSELEPDEAIERSRGSGRHPLVLGLAPVPPAAATPCLCTTDAGVLIAFDAGETQMSLVVAAPPRDEP